MAYLAKNTVKGTDYWRIVESRREGDKVRQVTIDYIGNTKKLSERLLGTGSQTSLKSYTCGAVRALMATAERLDVANTLNEVFGAKTRDGVDVGTSLLLAAIHRACDPGSKRSFSRWFEGTVLPFDTEISPGVMTSQHFWEQMDKIPQEKLEEAEDAISAKVCAMWDTGLGRLALDYTNYYTFIATANEKAKIAKRGHNKQKRNDLRQYSLAVVTTKDLGIPLFSYVYEGNTNDSKAFCEYLEVLGQRMSGIDPKDITLVFDGGSVTKENLEGLCHHYITGFSLSSAKALYDIPKDDYIKIALCSGAEVAAYRLETEVWGKVCTCVLTLSESLLAGQVRGLDSDILKASSALDELEGRLQNPRSRIKKDEASLKQMVDVILKDEHVRSVVSVKVADGYVSYSADEGKKAEIAARFFGKKLIVTDHTDWATAEIISAYREQDSVEKVFRDTKGTGHFSLQPTYHWTDQKIRVHVFICLLGLILATVLNKELSDEGVKLSKDVMLDELEGIREGWIIEKQQEKKGSGSKKGKTATVKKIIEDMNPLQSQLWEIVSRL